MKEFLLGFQILCLVVQIGCFLYGVTKSEDLFKIFYGFAIWGSIPNVLAGIIGKCI